MDFLAAFSQGEHGADGRLSLAIVQHERFDAVEQSVRIPISDLNLWYHLPMNVPHPEGFPEFLPAPAFARPLHVDLPMFPRGDPSSDPLSVFYRFSISHNKSL